VKKITKLVGLILSLVAVEAFAATPTPLVSVTSAGYDDAIIAITTTAAGSCKIKVSKTVISARLTPAQFDALPASPNQPLLSNGVQLVNIPGLTPSTKYYLAVKLTVAGVESVMSAPVSFTTSTTPPALPATTVVLVWDPNVEPDLASYKVYYGNKSLSDPTFTGWTNTSEVKPIPPVNNIPTTQTIVLQNMSGSVFFVVTAINNTGLESGYSNEVRVD